MKKMTIIASIVALSSAAAIATFALRGANKLVDFQVNAGPVERSVTFDENSNIEIPPGSDDYAICTTTAIGNKVGVVGSLTYNPLFDHLYFRDKTNNFGALELADFSCRLLNVGALEFGNITGFMISFEGGSLVLKKGLEMEGSPVSSGVKYDMSLTHDDEPAFEMDEHSEGDVIISSLTIWYSC